MRPPAEIAHDIKQAMTQKGMTQSRLALITHVDQSQLSRFLRGQFTSFSPNLSKVCEYLEVGIQVEGTEPSPPQEHELARFLIRLNELSGAKKKAAIRLIRALNDLLN